jgi:hypothetical protein
MKSCLKLSTGQSGTYFDNWPQSVHGKKVTTRGLPSA